jgi:hypothetical protein
MRTRPCAICGDETHGRAFHHIPAKPMSPTRKVLITLVMAVLVAFGVISLMPGPTPEQHAADEARSIAKSVGTQLVQEGSSPRMVATVVAMNSSSLLATVTARNALARP